MQKYNKSFRNYAGGLWFRLCSYASADTTLDGNIFTVKAARGVANVTLRAGFAANSASGVTVDSPESDARRWESLFLTEYDPFVHEEVQATGHAQRQQVTPHDIPLEHFLYKKQEGHLDKKGTDTGEVVAAQVTEKRPCGTARHPVLPDKEIGHDEIGHGGALERDDRRDDVLAHISAEKPLGADPKHESVHDRSKEARRGKLDESFA